MCVACLLKRSEVKGLFTGRRLPDGDRHLGREHEIDLLVEDAILVWHGDRSEQHAEDVVAVWLDRRPGVLVGVTLGDEPVDRATVEPDGCLRKQLLPRGIQQVDPARGRAHGPESSARVGRR